VTKRSDWKSYRAHIIRQHDRFASVVAQVMLEQHEAESDELVLHKLTRILIFMTKERRTQLKELNTDAGRQSAAFNWRQLMSEKKASRAKPLKSSKRKPTLLEMSRREMRRTLNDGLFKVIAGHVEILNQVLERRETSVAVDLTNWTVTIASVRHQLKGEQEARWLKVLAEHRGQLISGPQLKTFDTELDGVRTDRLLNRLPDPVKRILEVAGKKGTRMKVT
jgi:hypothetical protein